MRTGFLVVVLACIALVPPVAAQEGCSTPEALAQLSQGTFLGTPVEVLGDGAESTVTFRVEEVFSGPLPSEGTVDVRIPSAYSGDLAGLTGVIVNREDAGWASDGCRLLDPDLLREIAPTSVSPASLGENERETLKEPPLWLFFGIFGGGIGAALLLQRGRERRARDS